jgi:hypothetical protein
MRGIPTRGCPLSVCPRCSHTLAGRVYLALAAEVLFLRRQLAMLVERRVRPRRARPLDRLWLVWTARLFDWREALVVVKPATLIRWQRGLVRSLWRWKSSRGGRPKTSLAEFLRTTAGAHERSHSDTSIWNETAFCARKRAAAEFLRTTVVDLCPCASQSLGNIVQCKGYNSLAAQHIQPTQQKTEYGVERYIPTVAPQQ